jgi:RNA polymerase sigma-70 factor, ECF subfamily
MNIRDKIYLECREKIKKNIQSKIADAEIVNDIGQEVFIRFATKAEDLNNNNLCSYLLRISDNLVNDHYRKIKYKGYAMPLEIMESDKEWQTEKQFVMQENVLMNFVNNLPEMYKEALVLTEIDGISQKELANRLNISYSGIKSRVQRAKLMLRNAMLNCCNYKFDRYGNLISCCETDSCC